MNQGRIWCVVNPTVGLPLFLGSVAVTSLIVHAAVMTHTPWMSAYWTGAAKPKVAMEGTTSPSAVAQQSAAPYVVTVAPVAGTAGKPETSFVVTVAPNPDATTVRPPAKLALAAPPAK
jgi:light-harvesting protein B-800-850 alpha chain